MDMHRGKIHGGKSSNLSAAALLLALLLAATVPASAAYRTQRPITNDGGRLNQAYLYGEVWSAHQHKGVDLTYSFGTHVYAIADGTVVELYEDVANGTFPKEGEDDLPADAIWGNFVLIRHDRSHWDRA